jgi:hypothetical protein
MEKNEREKAKEASEISAEQEGILALSDELKILLASFLKVSDVLTLSKVNSNLHFLSTDNQLWKALFIRDFFHLFSEEEQRKLLNDKAQDWKKLYRDEVKKKCSNILPSHRNLFVCAYVGDVINLSRLLNTILERRRNTTPINIVWSITVLKDNQKACLLEVAAVNNDLQLIKVLLNYIANAQNKETFVKEMEKSAIASLKIALKNGNLAVAIAIVIYFKEQEVLYKKSLDDLLQAVEAIEPALSAASTISQSLKFLVENTRNYASNLDWIKEARFFPEAEKYLVEAYGVEEFKNNALTETVIQNDDKYVKYLVEQWGLKVNPSETNFIGHLYYAIRQANIPLTEYLITQGADIRQKKGIVVIDAALMSETRHMFMWVLEKLKQTEIADNIRPIIRAMLKDPPEELNALFLISLVRELKIKENVVADENDPSVKILETMVDTLNEKIHQGISSATTSIKIIKNMLFFAKEFSGILSAPTIFKAWYQEFREKYPNRYPLLELTAARYSENKSKFYPSKEAPGESKQDGSMQIINELKEFIGNNSASLINDILEKEKSEKINRENNHNKAPSSGRCTIS